MTKVTKIKRSQSQSTIKDKMDGCILVPLSERKPHYPATAKNILPYTYYRVVESEDRVRAMVTIMPDGLHVAWDSCARCLQHIVRCPCKSGVYHSRSIGWIRATFDINYPTERVTEYSKYYDPWQRHADSPINRLESGIGRVPGAGDTPKRKKAKVVDGGLTVNEIENIDLAKLNQAATKQAKRTVRRARSVIRGSK